LALINSFLKLLLVDNYIKKLLRNSEKYLKGCKNINNT